jgi:ribonuclease D
MQLITTTQELSEACQRLAQNPFVTVDTEFMRESTYYPELCLIQMAGGDVEALVDPLAPGLDLAPFFTLMADQSVLKVFHAARQDLEIVFLKSGLIPKPLFDTQIAAMVCGFGDSVSFSTLVQRVTGAEVDKSSQFTDWRRRPLTKKQLTYAIGDVTYLIPIYQHLAKELERAGRSEWLNEEMGELTSPLTYSQKPEEAWQRLKLRVKSKKALGVLVEIAAWREVAAQSQNVPRSRVLKDDAIYDIANQMPQTAEQLSELRTIHNGFARSARGPEVLDAVKRGLARDQRSLPAMPKGAPMPAETLAILDLLRVLLKAVAAEHGVAPKMIASADELEQIARDDEADVHALKGWRRELFGVKALQLKAGSLVLGMKGGNVRAMALATGNPAVEIAAT